MRIQYAIHPARVILKQQKTGKIQQETGIPIGLIRSVSSGTPIEPFCTAEGLASVPELAEEKAKLDKQMLEYRSNLAGTLPKLESYVAAARKALNNNTELPEPVQMPEHPATMNRPCGWHCIYNGMIHPLVNFGIKGALWYQGETNGSEGDLYYDPMVKDPQGKLQKFAIAGEDKKWVWADAVIVGKSVVVSSPEVPKPVAVRYAYSINPDGCNLYNNEGLPASPFRTDSWLRMRVFNGIHA